MKTNSIFKDEKGALRIKTPDGEVLDHLIDSMTIRESGKGHYTVTLDLFCKCGEDESENDCGIMI